MKMTKKLISIVMVIAILASLAVTAFAEDESTATGTDGTTKHNITISGAIEGARYDGYKLLNVSTSLKPEGCAHDSDPTSPNHLSSCYNVAYEANSKYLSILQTKTGKSLSGDIVEYIKALNTAEAIQSFADDVYYAISTTTISPDITGSAQSDTIVFSDVEQGYWLFVEVAPENYQKSHSLIMLDTSGSRDLNITTKRDDPTLIKHVRDNGLSYGHGADVQIGDAAEFLIITDVPNPLGYDTYEYIVHDKMDSSLTFNPSSVKIQLNGVDTTNGILNPTYYDLTPNTSSTTPPTDDCTFEIRINIQKATADGVLKADDRLYITYTATLNENAKILTNGTESDITNANENTAWLEYSNDPAQSTDTNHSTVSTEPMKVYVWTFPLELNKVDANGTQLDGAKFVLSRDSSLTEADLKDNNSDGKPDGFTNMLPMIAGQTTGEYRVAPAGYTGAVVYEIDAGTAKLQGFDDQVEYYLYETVAPAGYNKLTAPVSFKFFATYESSEHHIFKSGFPKVSINTGAESGVLEANIVNQTGAELPSTGGIGTTIFYVAGGLLVAAAIVLLITRKRMGTAE